ncbi:YkvI family membrane protein [Maledivibacter halophilus]|uniref:Uncharacterized membrane protein YkvI n=1 Tax=Maledivibacter halophilus TaxID=36842 RepID=A0A1T5IDE3_9FIRM|nr:hypothetical protein [Maledivibacter halophilus]SKC37167.1 Uncharacterized membrane protein YkvI [Maledivibacter halophilus]
MSKEKKSFFDGAFGRYMLPGIILQSVLIGGGYATGREIVEFGGKFGALGWLGGVGIFIGFTIVSILTFEFARLFRTYNYKSLVEKLIGKGWIFYDIIYILLAILIIAVMASATGEIVENTIGIPYWGGVLGVIVIVGILQFYGSRLIERFETYGTIALYIGYIIFSAIVINATWGHAKEVFANGNTSFVEKASIPTILWTGMVYVGYNLAVYPAALFTLKRQTKRHETILAGIIAGIMMTIPWFLTYFAVMGFYPSEKILGASVPWLAMMQNIAAPWVVGLFGIVVGWTLIETSTGIIHGLLGRVDAVLEEKNKFPLTPKQNATITVIVLVLATVLAKVGIIDLIAKGYTAMAYGMILIFLLPILTIGVYKIFKGNSKSNF